MSVSPAEPTRTACPVCLHPLLIEVWSQADTFSGELVEEVVVVNPIDHRRTAVCPGCRSSVAAIIENYRQSME